MKNWRPRLTILGISRGLDCFLECWAMANKDKNKVPAASNGTSLKALAQYLHLSQGTISLVINRSPAAAAIPQETQARILEAAKKLTYRPNFFARSLPSRRRFTVALPHPDPAAYLARVIGSSEQDLP